MTYRSSQDFAQETSAFRRFVYGMIRKFAVTLTDTARWQLLGQRGGAGGDEILPNIESFTGIGFYSRPASSGNPEAIAVAVGGTRTTVVIAARDEAMRQAIAGSIAAGETAMFNPHVIVLCKANGTVEIRAGDGAAAPLATLADVQALTKFVQQLTLPVSGSHRRPARAGLGPDARGDDRPERPVGPATSASDPSQQPLARS